MVDRRSSRYRKAGLSGLFLLGLTLLATAQPVMLEVQEAKVEFNAQRGEHLIFLKLTGESARMLADLTRRSVGKSMNLRFEGELMFSQAPVIQAPILRGVAVISNNLTAERAAEIAGRLSPGTKVVFEVIEWAN
jgi:preprotein translocase subunit SecD